MTDLYNGFSLRIGDNDDRRTYEGDVKAPEQAGTADHVRRLRLDLQELGFFLAKERGSEPALMFDRWLEEAVREFQVMARLSRVAHELAEPSGEKNYLRRLESVAVPASDRYPLPQSGATDRFASGIVNSTTRRLIALWKANRWRCPWVIAEWAVPEKPPRPKKSVKEKPKPVPVPKSPDDWVVGDRTLKRHDLCVAGRGAKVVGEVFLHDFSQRYIKIADPSVPEMRFYLGMERGSGGLRGPCGFPGLPDTQKQLIKISPQLLTGGPITAPESSKASTYRVVAAVASVEVSDGFQFVNAWDLAVLSAGLFHFTLMSVGNVKEASKLKFGKGELLGLLSWMEKHVPQEFADFIGSFGLWSESTWGSDGKALLNGRNGIWEGYLCRETASGVRDQPVKQHEQAVVLQSWQWLARFNMLPFVSPGYSQANWALARLRLRFIHGLSIGGDFPKTWRIGDVFTSERSIAKLLRVHVHGSGRLSVLPDPKQAPISAKWIRDVLTKELTKAEIAAGPGTWGDAVQRKLESRLDLAFSQYTAPKKSGAKTVEGDFIRLERWAHDGRHLSSAANSFKLMADDLDPM